VLCTQTQPSTTRGNAQYLIKRGFTGKRGAHAVFLEAISARQPLVPATAA
jgi:hypothetical protein